MGENGGDNVIAYLTYRIEIRKETAPPLQARTFTVENPHTCTQCHEEVYSGFRVGSGTRQWYLKRGLDDAVLAAKSGCAFYEMVLDLFLYKGIVHDWVSDRSKRSEMKFLFWFNMVEPWYAQLWTQFGEKTLDHVSPNALDVWTRETDVVEGVWLNVRPTGRNVASAKSMKFAHDSLRECVSTHEICRQNYSTSDNLLFRNGFGNLKWEILNVSDLPTRLLMIYPLAYALRAVQFIAGSREAKNWNTRCKWGGNVGKAKLGVKLVEVGELEEPLRKTISKSGFASLSYCWGGQQSFQLDKDTRHLLAEGIEITQLPKTLQDAIRVSIRIGIDYIWIDAFCILQDDPEDKGQEIARMPLYYGANTVTICAASADKSSQGFLHERPEQPYRYGPFQIRYTAPNGQGFFQLLQERSMDGEPISKRAWTLQESLLSRRLLIFSSRQLYWHCMHFSMGCAGLDGRLTNHTRYSVRPLVPQVYPISALNNLSTSRLWEYLVRDYMSRTLGLESDRLVAISALSAHISRFFKARHQSTEYLAGLWFSPDNQRPFLRHLFWSTNLLVSRRPREYRAPSWSWASIDGPVYFFENLTEGMVYPSPEAHIVDKNITVRHAVAAYGAVTGGWIIIQAVIRTVDPGTIAVPIIVPKNGRDQAARGNDTQLILCPDTEEDKRLIELWREGKQSIYFLQIWPYHQSLNSPMGLLLVQISNPLKAYRRMGTFYFDRGMFTKTIMRNRNEIFEEPKDTRIMREEFFAYSDIQDVRVE